MVQEIKSYLKKQVKPEDPHTYGRQNRNITILSALIVMISAAGIFYKAGSMNEALDNKAGKLELQATQQIAIDAKKDICSKANQATMDSILKAVIYMNELNKLKNAEQDKYLQFLMDNCKFKTRGN